jgi:hypothetical protein
LVLLPSGAIAFVLQHHASGNFAWPVALFGLAIVFALGAGIIGWINLQCASTYYCGAADDVLEGRPERPHPNIVGYFALASLALAALSAILSFLGGGAVWLLLFFGARG